MKKFLVTGLLLIALLVSVSGCGDNKAAKVKEFSDYFQQENKIATNFDDNLQVAEKNMNNAQSPEDFSKQLNQSKEIFKGFVKELNSLKTPTELKAYKDKEIEIINQLITSFDNVDQAVKNKDLNSIESEGKKIEDLGSKSKDQKMYALIEKAAKDAGIKVEKQGDKLLFKK